MVTLPNKSETISVSEAGCRMTATYMVQVILKHMSVNLVWCL